MNGALIGLFIFICVPVLILLILAIYQEIDYKRQVNGKKKIRPLKDSQVITPEKEKFNLDAELLQHQAQMKSAQNLFGPRI